MEDTMKNEKNFTRRQFITSTILSSGGFIALNNKTNNSELTYGSYINKNPERDYTVIKKVFLAKPVPTWPCPDIDLDAEMRKINNQLSDFEKLWNFKVRFAGGELLRVQEDFPKFENNLGEFDGIVIFPLTSTMMYMINNIVNLGYPAVLFNQPASGHD